MVVGLGGFVVGGEVVVVGSGSGSGPGSGTVGPTGGTVLAVGRVVEVEPLREEKRSRIVLLRGIWRGSGGAKGTEGWPSSTALI